MDALLETLFETDLGVIIIGILIIGAIIFEIFNNKTNT